MTDKPAHVHIASVGVEYVTPRKFKAMVLLRLTDQVPNAVLITLLLDIAIRLGNPSSGTMSPDTEMDPLT
jgi:hypothetical protein